MRASVEFYKDRQTIAISLFSGSHVDEVADLLSQIPSLSGALFGSSRKVNINSNFVLLKSTKHKDCVS